MMSDMAWARLYSTGKRSIAVVLCLVGVGGLSGRVLRVAAIQTCARLNRSMTSCTTTTCSSSFFSFLSSSLSTCLSSSLSTCLSSYLSTCLSSSLFPQPPPILNPQTEVPSIPLAPVMLISATASIRSFLELTCIRLLVGRPFTSTNFYNT